MVTNGVIATVAGNGTQGYGGDGGPANSAELYNPTGVVIDAFGNLFVSEFVRVREVVQGTIRTAAGGGVPVGDGGPAVNSQLDYPTGIALGPSGQLYIADQNSARVRMIANGVVTTVAGNGNQGNQVPRGSSVPALDTELYNPAAVAADSMGDLYVGEFLGLAKISDGTLPNELGLPGSDACANGPVGGASALWITGLAVDPSGDVYLADYFQDCIREISNGTITAAAGESPTGGPSPGPAANARLSELNGIALDAAGNLYIADKGNDLVWRVSNSVITIVAGSVNSQGFGNLGFSGDGGPATSAVLSYPSGVALDAHGNIFIADTGNGRIREVSGGVITTIAGNGKFGFSGDNGPALAASMYLPYGIAVDSSGNVYFSDSSTNRIRMLIPSSVSNCTYSISPLQFATTAAGGSFTATVQTSPGCTWGVAGLPDWIAASGSATNTGPGSITLNVVANSGVSPLQAFLSIAGFAVDVTQQGYLSVNAGGVVNAASYAAPVAPGSIASVFGDFPLRSLEANTTLPLSTDFAVPGGMGNFSLLFLNTASPLFFGSSSQVNIKRSRLRRAGLLREPYISDSRNSLVRKVSGGIITTVAGGGQFGNGRNSGPATSVFISPESVAVDTAGSLYIGDSAGVVREVTKGMISTVAGNGTLGYSGDGGPATSAELGDSLSLAVDPSGSLLIADYANARVRKVTQGVIQTIAGGGPPVGDGGPAVNAQLVAPLGIAFDPSGNLYVADQDSNRVRMISNGITTVAGKGNPGYAGSNGPALDAELATPLSVAADATGDVYVGETACVSKITHGLVTPVTQLGCNNGWFTPFAIAVSPSGNVYIADTFNEVVRKVANGTVTAAAGEMGQPGYGGDEGPTIFSQIYQPEGPIAPRSADP